MNVKKTKPIKEPVLDPYEREIINFSTSLCKRLLEKYRKGKLEHGGLPTRLNCRREISLEVYDILIYHQIDRVNKRLKKRLLERRP